VHRLALWCASVLHASMQCAALEVHRLGALWKRCASKLLTSVQCAALVLPLPGVHCAALSLPLPGVHCAVRCTPHATHAA